MRSLLPRIAPAAALLTISVLLAFTPSPLAADADWAEVEIGEVTVKHVPDLGFNVIVNRFDEASRDEVAENVYVVQTEEPPAIGLPITLDAAKLVFKEDHLIVVSLEEPWALGFFLSDTDPAKVKQLARGILEEYYGVAEPEMIHLASGYGLARHAGQFSLPLDRWPPARDGSVLNQKSTSGHVTAQASCTTGGPGALSASITCSGGITDGSVTCRSGYYACCKCTWYGEAQCSCEPDGSGSGGGGDCIITPPCDPYDEN